jgi:hypothetical protein
VGLWIVGCVGTVALALTVHEPGDRLLPLLEAQLPALAGSYSAVAALCSQQTNARVLALLAAHGAQVRLEEGRQEGVPGVGAVRGQALRAALEAGTSHIQLCDFDRALHWMARYPAELEVVARLVTHYDLLVLGRTPRAWSTHPTYQTETEALFNRVFFLATKLPWDVGAGSRGMSRAAAEWLLATSMDPTVGVDGEWPLLLLRADAASEPAFRLGYLACEGLEFETADRFGPEIEAAGGYDAWLARMEADPRRWAFRIHVAQLIAEAIARHSTLA